MIGVQALRNCWMEVFSSEESDPAQWRYHRCGELLAKTSKHGPVRYVLLSHVISLVLSMHSGFYNNTPCPFHAPRRSCCYHRLDFDHQWANMAEYEMELQCLARSRQCRSCTAVVKKTPIASVMYYSAAVEAARANIAINAQKMWKQNNPS